MLSSLRTGIKSPLGAWRGWGCCDCDDETVFLQYRIQMEIGLSLPPGIPSLASWPNAWQDILSAVESARTFLNNVEWTDLWPDFYTYQSNNKYNLRRMAGIFHANTGQLYGSWTPLREDSVAGGYLAYYWAYTGWNFYNWPTAVVNGPGWSAGIITRHYIWCRGKTFCTFDYTSFKLGSESFTVLQKDNCDANSSSGFYEVNMPVLPTNLLQPVSPAPWPTNPIPDQAVCYKVLARSDDIANPQVGMDSLMDCCP